VSALTQARNDVRGESVLPDVARLKLALPWPGVRHVNAYTLADSGGFAIIDTGAHYPGSLEQFELALADAGLRLEQANLIACTHAHSDHCGQAAALRERAGCEWWMRPDYGRALLEAGIDPDSGFAGALTPDRDFAAGTELLTAEGRWEVIETPGHAASSVCLYDRARRLLISGDHLLPRPQPHFDWGWDPDPVGRYLAGLALVASLDVRLCLPGHGRPFADVASRLELTRVALAARLTGACDALARGARTAADVARQLDSAPADRGTTWRQESDARCLLRRLVVTGRAVEAPDGVQQWWTA
jgi:glyoxylase-like metal-dependent hydrolase (beta-lactamase superfamily II)